MPHTVSSSGRSSFLVLTSLGLLSFFFNSDALAQAGSAQTVAAGAVTTANVDEVSLDLVVHDKSGKLVRDLQPGELEITDGGSPVRIKDLRRVNAGPGADPAHAVTLLFDQMDPETREARRLRPSPLSRQRMRAAFRSPFSLWTCAFISCRRPRRIRRRSGRPSTPLP